MNYQLYKFRNYQLHFPRDSSGNFCAPKQLNNLHLLRICNFTNIEFQLDYIMINTNNVLNNDARYICATFVNFSTCRPYHNSPNGGREFVYR